MPETNVDPTPPIGKTPAAEIVAGSAATTPAEAASLLCDDNECARLLDCSKRFWHGLVAKGEAPPPIRLGRLVRWSREVITAWIKSGCPDAAQFAAEQAAESAQARAARRPPPRYLPARASAEGGGK